MEYYDEDYDLEYSYGDEDQDDLMQLIDSWTDDVEELVDAPLALDREALNRAEEKLAAAIRADGDELPF